MAEKKEILNPDDYTYKGDEKMEISGAEFTKLFQTVNGMLTKEMREYYPQFTMWVNEKGEKVEEGTEGATQSFDFDSTLNNAEPQILYTALGRELMRLKLFLLQKHHENAQNGIAVKKVDSTMEVVEE